MRDVIRQVWVVIAILLLAYAVYTLITGAVSPTTGSPIAFFVGNAGSAYVAMALSAGILASIWYVTHEH